MTLPQAVALALASLVGFAAHRASLCTVKAVERGARVTVIERGALTAAVAAPADKMARRTWARPAHDRTYPKGHAAQAA